MHHRNFRGGNGQGIKHGKQSTQAMGSPSKLGQRKHLRPSHTYKCCGAGTLLAGLCIRCRGSWLCRECFLGTLVLAVSFVLGDFTGRFDVCCSCVAFCLDSVLHVRAPFQSTCTCSLKLRLQQSQSSPGWCSHEGRKFSFLGCDKRRFLLLHSCKNQLFH